ncbi:magnesium chelatase subunit D family protein [Dyadobacter sp. CY261]|uniref:magnesium chelatase subunit D family protein n=1 Tax=Dyadobacter sp. CY261 TaxID=2907203 RepID=UPI001F29C1AB|nr:magnesium chelatase subunit D family protein [Dyadobacter sp. CY261]MCF0071155.1 magnesium chelatase subunit D family protein [Dyadobacter sp. CY261]
MTLYPFAAIVGQEKLKKALLLCAINPGIGGVLIKGDKGTAKSTAVRGLAAVMPPLGSHGESVPFVDLPLGASEDRVLGSLDIEAILANKTKKLLPGLLAGAHQGILYIDEVNLLADHLVDVLLDVAASGVNTVQREGLSVSHPARFVLIGTMNPEEGNLRPQFLDRFGMMVEVSAQTDVHARTEVVRRRIAFERDPMGFVDQWVSGQEVIKEQISRAQQLLPSVQVADGLLKIISQLCIEWGVSSLRGDIVMYKTALTIAALNNRTTVTPDDVREAAELVLTHRKGKKALPPQPNKSSDDKQDDLSPKEGKPSSLSSSLPNEDAEHEDDHTKCDDGECGEDIDEQIVGIYSGINVPELFNTMSAERSDLSNGRSVKAKQTTKGYQVRAIKSDHVTDIAVTETVLHSIIRDPDGAGFERQDLHQKIRNDKTGHLILFVVDASGSMAAGKRMEAVKGSVMNLLQDAYQKRNMVAVISFRGVEATVLLEPTRSTELAEQALEKLPTGGRTPLPHALQLAEQMLSALPGAGGIQPFLVILSDGKANVPLQGGNGDAWGQSLQIARELNCQALVLDTESGYVRYGKARTLAEALGAEYLSLEELSADQVMETVSERIVI